MLGPITLKKLFEPFPDPPNFEGELSPHVIASPLWAGLFETVNYELYSKRLTKKLKCRIRPTIPITFLLYLLI